MLHNTLRAGITTSCLSIALLATGFSAEESFTMMQTLMTREECVENGAGNLYSTVCTIFFFNYAIKVVVSKFSGLSVDEDNFDGLLGITLSVQLITIICDEY